MGGSCYARPLPKGVRAQVNGLPYSRTVNTGSDLSENLRLSAPASHGDLLHRYQCLGTRVSFFFNDLFFFMASALALSMCCDPLCSKRTQTVSLIFAISFE